MKLEEPQLNAARAHLLGDGSDALIRFMAGQSVSLDASHSPGDVEDLARDAGWLMPGSAERTTLGVFVSDSCREYLFWSERNKELPFEDDLKHLPDGVFDGKYIAEIGAGMGANMMSLAGRADRLCGVEPIEVYAQLGNVFSEREGLHSLEMRIGGAEALPFEDNTLDLVLCVSAHQYFDIIPAFREIARVLKPGGEVIVIGGTFSSYVDKRKKHALGGPEAPKAIAITILNTLGYMALGRRLILNRGPFSTSRPIYPTCKAMIRWMDQAGFRQIGQPIGIGAEACFYARLR